MRSHGAHWLRGIDGVKALPARVLSCRQIDRIDDQLKAALHLDIERHVSAGLVTCDQDDAMYVALDHATKFADVDVVFARSFYAGAKHASGPYSGEILGIIAGPNPDDVAEGLYALLGELTAAISFHTFIGGEREQPSFFAHVLSESGRYLAPLAGIPVGAPLTYLIAPPLEATIGIDAALKRANVRLTKWLPPPSETNFAGAYLSGALADVEAAALAFVEAVRDVANAPLAAARAPERARR